MWKTIISDFDKSDDEEALSSCEQTEDSTRHLVTSPYSRSPRHSSSARTTRSNRTPLPIRPLYLGHHRLYGTGSRSEGMLSVSVAIPNANNQYKSESKNKLQPVLGPVFLFKYFSPCVVSISNITYSFHPIYTQVEELRGVGSGFYWNNDGFIVTNFHVIEGAEFVRVTTSDNIVFTAKIVGVNTAMDLAVLKVDKPGDTICLIPVGKSYDLSVGQKSYTIGNPFGYNQTLTTGVVSALGRGIALSNRFHSDTIQLDGNINPGNSGGPLINSSGSLVGIIVGGISPHGVGFAIRIEAVIPSISNMIARYISLDQ